MISLLLFVICSVGNVALPAENQKERRLVRKLHLPRTQMGSNKTLQIDDEMTPWRTAIAHDNPPGNASVFGVEVSDIPSFLVPIFGGRLPAGSVGLRVGAWIIFFAAWLWLLANCKQDVIHKIQRYDTVSAIWQEATGVDRVLIHWFANPGMYASLDIAVSFFLLLITAGVFLNGMYLHMPVSLPKTSEAPLLGDGISFFWNWFGAATAAGGSLLLLRANSLHDLNGRLHAVTRGASLLCIWSCASAYFYLRLKAMKAGQGPLPCHVLLSVDWSLLAILLACSARDLGVQEWICSSWLRKFVMNTMALMFVNSGVAKLLNTGLVWCRGGVLRSILRNQRQNSIWPWLNDFLSGSPYLCTLAASCVLLFELPLSILVISGLPMNRGTTGALHAKDYIGLNIVQRFWAIFAIMFHFGTYVLLFPPFMENVHVLLSLVLDPFSVYAWRILSPSIGSSRESTVLSEQQGSLERVMPLLSRAALRFLAGLLIFTAFCWIYVGIRCHAQNEDPAFPFSSMPMYSQ